jgi:hypothetical protein
MYAQVEERIDRRVEEFKEFQQHAAQLDLKEDHAFQDMLRQAQVLLEISDQQIADGLLVSRPSVNRWVRGKNLPHPALRKSIVSWVIDQLSRRIKLLDGIGRSAANQSAVAR